jgi:hypothetical protein
MRFIAENPVKAFPQEVTIGRFLKAGSAASGHRSNFS